MVTDVVVKIPFPLSEFKTFKFNADDVNKLKDYLKQQQ